MKSIHNVINKKLERTARKKKSNVRIAPSVANVLCMREFPNHTELRGFCGEGAPHDRNQSVPVSSVSEASHEETFISRR